MARDGRPNDRIAKGTRVTDKIAFITGVTGQDGSLLARSLLEKGYEVHGLRRRSSTANTARLERTLADAPGRNNRFQLYSGDVTDSASLNHILKSVAPTEIYNLAGQSHVRVSFDAAEHTADVNGLGALRLLEAIRILGLGEKVRFFQASTSELYGDAQVSPQSEETPFRPRSPYAAAKLYAYWITRNYREGYGLHASNGILFNHESPLRGDAFVTRKITRGVARIARGYQETIHLGNLSAVRDWGHARDYVEGMWRILQAEPAGDYVLATGDGHTVREFVERAFERIGVTIAWRGADLDEQGYDVDTGAVRVRVDPKFFRPTEVDRLIGDASKAHRMLDWAPTISFDDMVAEMVESDLADVKEGDRPAAY